eukprot:Gb_26359 [translate_table: standard]
MMRPGMTADSMCGKCVRGKVAGLKRVRLYLIKSPNDQFHSSVDMNMLSFFLCVPTYCIFCLFDTGCPLDFSNLDFKEVVSACFAPDRGRCCRFVNAVVGISMSRYTNSTSQLAVPPSSFEVCLNAISDTLQSNGLSSNVTAFCGLGTKITVNFQCKGRTNIQAMEGTPKFKEVQLSCTEPVSVAENCRKCLDASFIFLHNLVDAEDNTTLSICRDATFVTIASYGNSEFAADKASCFFGVHGLERQPAAVPVAIVALGHNSSVAAAEHDCNQNQSHESDNCSSLGCFWN